MTRRLDAAIRDAARRLSASPTPTLDARVLMKAALGCDDAALIAGCDRLLSAAETARFEAMVERRRLDEPVAHIAGKREFWSLDIEVAPGVLVPRTDSETLIEAALRRRGRNEALAILDLGSGSGALLCALLSEFPSATGLAVDCDERAVALSARNLQRLGFAVRSRALRGDWFAAVAGVFDLIITNPPYIRLKDRDALPREVSCYEDARALFAGEDGLDAIRRILPEAALRLSGDGLLIVEFGEGQADMVKELARNAFPRAKIGLDCDLGGRPRAAAVDLREG